MFFRSHHPEDKRMFSFLLVATILLFSVIAYALMRLAGQTPPPSDQTALEDVRENLESQLSTLNEATLDGSLEAIEDFLITEELKAKINQTVSADSAVTSTPGE